MTSSARDVMGRRGEALGATGVTSSPHPFVPSFPPPDVGGKDDEDAFREFMAPVALKWVRRGEGSSWRPSPSSGLGEGRGVHDARRPQVG